MKITKIVFSLLLATQAFASHDTFNLKNRSLTEEIKLECFDNKCEEILVKLYSNNEYQEDVFFFREEDSEFKRRSTFYPIMQGIQDDVKSDWKKGKKVNSVLWSLMIPMGYVVESLSVPQTIILKNIKNSCEYNFKILKRTLKTIEKSVTRKTDLTLSDKRFDQTKEVFFSDGFLLEMEECLKPIVINDQIGLYSTPMPF